MFGSDVCRLRVEPFASYRLVTNKSPAHSGAARVVNERSERRKVGVNLIACFGFNRYFTTLACVR